MTVLTHGGLFEGYGGTTMAAALVLGPLDTRWVSDIKPAACALLAHRHPAVPNLGDMTTIDYRAVEPVDVLTASWPCQPHSSAGKRLGEKDPRALWPHVARAVAALRPAVFLGENVARIAGNGELRRVVRALADLGYVGAWRCIRASDIGAPHRRDRCFVVAVDPAADAVRRGLAEHPQRDGGAEPGRGGALGLDAVRRGARGADRLTLLPTPRAGDAVRGGGDATAAERAMRGDASRTSATGMSLPRAVTLLPTPAASTYGTNRGGAAGRVGPVRESLDTMARNGRFDRWGDYGPAIAHWERVLGRAAPGPTVPNARTGRPILAPAFVEWLMGLPAGHVTAVPGLSRPQMLSLLGDGVVPQQGAAAYRTLLAHLAERVAAEAAA